MNNRYLFTAALIISLLHSAAAQNKKADSLQVVATLKTLLSACKYIDFTDVKVNDSGMFYKAAPYIIYRGDDKKRAWKDFANYKDEQEKLRVDDVCLKINRGLNQDSSYVIEKYFTETESEGTWHVLMISYIRKGVAKKTAYAFLKVNGRFGLGDID
jgi:hypothetical protein